MPDLNTDGMTKVTWMLTCSTTSAPTTAELNAGVSLESYITPDGLDIAVTTTGIDAGSLASTQDQQIPGRRRDDIKLTMKQQGQAAAPWTTFASRPSGFLVVRRDIAASTAWTAAQNVQVYPCRAGDRQQLKPAANDLSKFEVSFFVTAPVVDSATVG
jgi:hypothetical protein